MVKNNNNFEYYRLNLNNLLINIQSVTFKTLDCLYDFVSENANRHNDKENSLVVTAVFRSASETK